MTWLVASRENLWLDSSGRWGPAICARRFSDLPEALEALLAVDPFDVHAHLVEANVDAAHHDSAAAETS